MEYPEGRSPASYRGTRLRRVNWPEEIETVRRLFLDYRQWLAKHEETSHSVDPRRKAGLRQIDDQIAGLPGEYGPPRGEVILAFAKKALVACGALRELEPKVGEIKRIYVRADHRGPGFGPRLTRALLRRARELGYERIRVDTLPSMFAANQFYPAMGFEPIAPYWPHPVAGALFFEYRLGKSRSSRRASRAPPSGRARK